MDSAVERAISSISKRLLGQKPTVTSGVSVEKGERQTTIEVSNAVRESIISGVECATGLEMAR